MGKGRFIGFISAVSVVGIALGVMVLITVMSVMNGFREEVQNRVLDLSPHVTVYGDLTLDPELRETLRHDEAVRTSSSFVEFQGMIKSRYRVAGAMVKGVDVAHIDEIFPLSEHLTSGSLAPLKDQDFQIILGIHLAESLGVLVGDKIWLMVPVVQSSIAGAAPRMRQFTVAGIFEVGYVFDQGVAFVSIQDGKRLIGRDGVSGDWLKLYDPFLAPDVVARHQEDMPPDIYMTDWTIQNQNYFEAVKVEKTMMFFILTLIVAIAAFNLVSSLVMLVTDKKSDIAILMTMGARPKQIRRIFVCQGVMLGWMGTFSGVLLGVLLSLNVTSVVHAIEVLLGRHLLSAAVYYIDYLPSSLHISDILWIASISLLLSFVATLYPAGRAMRIMPAEALHHGH